MKNLIISKNKKTYKLISLKSVYSIVYFLFILLFFIIFPVSSKSPNLKKSEVHILKKGNRKKHFSLSYFLTNVK